MIPIASLEISHSYLKLGKVHTCIPLIWGTRASATVSGSSASALKKRRAMGDASFSSRSVSTMPGDRL